MTKNAHNTRPVARTARPKPNMAMKKNPMPVQDPHERSRNFDEVALGYTVEQAVDEAARCLDCKNKPCVGGCPVAIDIPAFIMKVRERDFEEAYRILSASTSLPAVCGRVCPQEIQCEARCVRGIKGEPVAIGRLERFVADYHLRHVGGQQDKSTADSVPHNNRKVAIVGAGPAGLTCAGELARRGYDVTIFEALHEPGGVLVYGIPQFRLPEEIVQQEIGNLKAAGVTIQTNMVIGKILSVDDLFNDGYEAVFIGSGAGLPRFMNIPGENLKGVYSANEFLTRINLMKAYLPDSQTPIQRARRVAVVGGGNVAMDAARCAKRLGAEQVFIVYRRGRAQMPARVEEIEHAEEEGIVFHTLTNPVEILGDDQKFATGLKCTRMELGAPDESGRRRAMAVEGSDFVLDVDSVIMAIGTSPNPLIHSTTDGLKTNNYGCIITNEETGMTSRRGVFAGGDAVTGAATVILAMGAGRTAAQSIDRYLINKTDRQSRPADNLPADG